MLQIPGGHRDPQVSRGMLELLAGRWERGLRALCCPLPAEGWGCWCHPPAALTNTAAPSSACSASRWRCKSCSFPRLRGWQVPRAGALQMEAELLRPSHHGSAR